MGTETQNILILCTGNSARSILGEALINHLGAGRLRGYSAGSNPAGKVNPLAIELLKARNLPVAGLRSKNWSEFEGPEAPVMDFVITVCDNAANEVCPVWPGHPVSAHWGLPDPAAVEGDKATRMQAFEQAFAIIEQRVEAFLAVLSRPLEPDVLLQQIRRIGESEIESA